VTCEPVLSPVPPFELALARTFAVTVEAVISPLNRTTEDASAVALADGAAPVTANADAFAEAARAIEPSAG
jgi:hypothetical protein